MTVGGTGLDYAVDMIHAVCRLAGMPSFVNDVRTELQQRGIIEAVDHHNTATLFDWLAAALSFQSVSDWIAHDYMARHDRATWNDIAGNLTTAPPCPKLKSYWDFYHCRYHKGSGTCAEPAHLTDCPLPTHNLRNGRLNQTAYSLFLFIRDVAEGDLIDWIDVRLAEVDEPNTPDRLIRLRRALLSPLGEVYGVSDKVLSMTLSSLLLGTGRGRERWAEVGGSMIVVDTLTISCIGPASWIASMAVTDTVQFVTNSRAALEFSRPSPNALTPVLSTRTFLLPSRGSCSMLCGGTAPSWA